MAAALAGQDWDPSVKSLVAFPRVLAMMDGELDWTERLGEAFLADEGAVMDSIQRLRRRAQAAGNLRASPQAAVATTPEAIVIEPPGAGTVYIPDCNPSVVYGGWTELRFPARLFSRLFRRRGGRRFRLRLDRRADRRAAVGLADLELARASSRHRPGAVRRARSPRAAAGRRRLAA